MPTRRPAAEPALTGHSIGVLDPPQVEQELSTMEMRAVFERIATLFARRPNMRVTRDALRLIAHHSMIDILREDAQNEIDISSRLREVIESLDITQPTEPPSTEAPEDQTPTRQGELSRDGERKGQLGEQQRVLFLLLEQQLRHVRLEDMWTWQNEALTQLHDLAAGRNGVGTASQALSSQMEREVLEAKERLVTELRKNAIAISILEADLGHWDAVADAARLAIRIGEHTAQEVIGHPLPPEVRPYLQLAYGRFMSQGNTPQLRSELRAATERVPNSSSLAYWLARYSIIAGDYEAAARSIGPFAKLPRIKNDLSPILDPELALDLPEQSHPCNFYTFRHSYIDDDVIVNVSGELAEIRDLKEVPPARPIRVEVDAAAAAAGATASATEQEVEAVRERKADLYDVDNATDPAGIKAGARAQLARRAAARRAQQAAEQAAAKAREAGEEKLADLKKKAEIGVKALDCLFLWNQANREMTRANYARAVRKYAACQMAILAYFARRYPGQCHEAPTQDGAYGQLVGLARYLNANADPVSDHYRRRSATINLNELYDVDWVRPKIAPRGIRIYTSGLEFLEALDKPRYGPKIQEKVDAPLLSIALVFAPLGIAEALRMQRNFVGAIEEYSKVLSRDQELHFLSQVIEIPFVKIMKGQVLLELGDSQYKGRRTQEAKQSYEDALRGLQDQGRYVERVTAGVTRLRERTGTLVGKSLHPLAVVEAPAGQPLPGPLAPDERRELDKLGDVAPIETVDLRRGQQAGLDMAPHEPLLSFHPPAGQSALKESNPALYALAITAKAKLVQLEAGLNYFGYPDDYVPPWRFEYLLARARQFAEHAKNAQRDYLNFLERAEAEEFKEMGAAQNVSLEKSNIRTEDAIVAQSRSEVEAAKQGQELAALVARDATRRIENYRAFDQRADEAAEARWEAAQLQAASEAVKSVEDYLLKGRVVAGVLGVASAFASLGAEEARLAAEAEQRHYELANLRLGAGEAQKAEKEASAKLEVAKNRLVVAALQRTTALMRHDFAVQNLAFLRQDRTLTAELWYRLAHLIRGVSDTYLRYAVEAAFLAEQALEFETGRELNVVRFDYDASEVAGLLAADFLLKDLASLEQDLIVTQRERQQQVRYVVSLARDFPSALQQLRQSESTVFSVTLRQLELRLPGLYGIRLSAVDVVPVALMDATRFSLQLTSTGASQIRTRGRPDRTSVPSWLSQLDDRWPVKMRLTSPETVVFSGLTPADVQARFPPLGASQRNPFEGLGAATSWHMDMSMAENRVEPSTLVDVLVSLYLTGYHDATLKTAIESAPAASSVLTQYISVAQQFPDAFYEFNQSGRVEVGVGRDLLSIGSPLGRLRNLGVMIVPSTGRSQFNPLTSRYSVQFTIDSSGQFTVISEIPKLTFTADGRKLTAEARVSSGSTVAWNFGDSPTWEEGATREHEYGRQGTYEVALRVTKDGRLSEYTAEVTVFDEKVVLPLTAFPTVKKEAGAPNGYTRVIASTEVGNETGLAATWKLRGRVELQREKQVTFDLAPGTYELGFLAVREVRARIYSRQRFAPDEKLVLERLRITSNRVFDSEGKEEQPAKRNLLAQHLFGKGEISPVDQWTVELRASDNPMLQAGPPSGEDGVVLGALQDVILILEYEAVGVAGWRPSVLEVKPATGEQCTEVDLVLQGQGLEGAHNLRSASGGIYVERILSTKEEVKARIRIHRDAPLGEHRLAMTTTSGEADISRAFTVTPRARITGISPDSGAQGEVIPVVTITGQALHGAQKVSFGEGITAEVSSVQANAIQARLAIAPDAVTGPRFFQVEFATPRCPADSSEAEKTFTVTPRTYGGQAVEASPEVPVRVEAVEVSGRTPEGPPRSITVRFTKDIQWRTLTSETFTVQDTRGRDLGIGKIDPHPFTRAPEAVQGATFVFESIHGEALKGDSPIQLVLRLRGTGPSPILDIDGLPLDGAGNGSASDFVRALAIGIARDEH